MSNGPEREAYDLHNKYCRRNMWRRMKKDWWHIWFWQLVISDTFHNVCPLHTHKKDE